MKSSLLRSAGFGLALMLGTGLPTCLVVAPAFAGTTMAQALPDIADLVEPLLPAVVEISVQLKGTDQRVASSEDENPFKDFFDQFLKRKQQEGDKGQPKEPPKDDKKKTEKDKPSDKKDAEPGPPGGGGALGSGFIIDAKGLVVTNNHVIADAASIQVHLQDGTTLKAELIGHDPKTDLAVLKVKPDKDLPFVKFADSEKARIGQWVVAVGNPFGVGESVSLGIISAKGRDINSGPYDDFIQTDAAINKGNSGGPLFNLQGEVVGVNTAIFSPSGGSVGLGFSIPSNEARFVTDQLSKHGEVRRGWLGVKLQTLTPDVAEGLGMAAAKGALVADVTAGGPSEAAGLKAGDVITGFDGKTIEDNRMLRRTVADTDVGKEVDVVVLREGKEQRIKVTLGRLDEGEKIAAAAADKPKDTTPPADATVLGMSLSAASSALREKYKLPEKFNGVIVTAVAPNSAASDIDIGEGDVIQEVGGKVVTVPSDVQAAADQATKDGKNSLLALVARGGDSKNTRFVALKLKKVP